MNLYKQKQTNYGLRSTKSMHQLAEVFTITHHMNWYLLTLNASFEESFTALTGPDTVMKARGIVTAYLT